MTIDPTMITLRPIVQPDDLPFLYEVYAYTRLEELAPLGWTPEQVNGFLSMQFNAQHQHYTTHYATADYLIVLLAGEAVGRLYVYRTPREIEVMDIALLPDYRRRGIGSHLLRNIITEADQTGRTTTLYVEQNNPALGLYTRLGFRTEHEEGVYFFMKRPPNGSQPQGDMPKQ
jgi:ribosomal protein S18 acetylase RimI-like enzyme